MFKDGEVFSNFNNKKKTAQFTKSSSVAKIFDKYYQKVKIKLMKSFETTKNNAVGQMFFGSYIHNPKHRHNLAFCSIFGDIRA